jgi:hypothetical protein
MARIEMMSVAVLMAVFAGAVAAAPCPTCLVDLTITRTAGSPDETIRSFVADASARYRVTIEFPGGHARVWVTLNGEPLLTPDAAPPGSGPIVLADRALPATGSVTVRLAGAPGRSVRVQIQRVGAPPLAACPPWPGAVEPLFTNPLVPLTDVQVIQPLGDMSPPGHTLPTHHTYWDNGTERDGAGRPLLTGTLPVFAPGNLRVVGLQYAAEPDDFKVILRPCLDVQLYVDHVTRLSPALQAAFESARRYEYPGGAFALLDVPLDAGAPIGIGGGAPFDADGRLLESSGINVGLIDLRRPELAFANRDRYLLPDVLEEFAAILGAPPGDIALIVRDFPPQRLHQYCPLDYFVEPLAEQYRALLGSHDGSQRRTLEPRCGELWHDVPATLQGAWFEDKPANGIGPGYSNDSDESRLLAFAPDNVDPGRLTMSIGEGVAAPAGSLLPWEIPSGSYAFGVPRATGVVNRAFADVVPGATYCYEEVAPPFAGSSPLAGVILVEVSMTELWILLQPDASSCAAVPSTLRLSASAAARRYVR